MSKQARLRTQELRRAQEAAAAKQARQRRIIMAVSGVVILGLVAAIVFAIVKVAGGDDGPTASDRVVVPQNATAEGAIAVGDESAPVTVDIYYDYMCPACGVFEATNGGELDRLLEEGVIKVDLRPISFLDRTSNGTEYSTRAANAIATVADGAPEQVWDFHAALYANQPEEGTDGLDDDRIAEIAAEAGVPDDVVEAFGDETYRGWVASVTETAFGSGVEGTPTVKVDGEFFEGDVYSVGPLTEAIESAAEGK